MTCRTERENVICPHCDEYGVPGFKLGGRTFVMSGYSNFESLHGRVIKDSERAKSSNPKLFF